MKWLILCLFFSYFVYNQSQSDTINIANGFESSLSNILGDVSNSNTPEDILNLVTKIGNGNLPTGIDTILSEFDRLTNNQIDNIDATLSQLGLKNIDFLIQPFLQTISKATGLQIDRKNAAKNLLTLVLKSNSKFLSNSTKSLYKNVAEIAQSSESINSAKSVDPNVMLAILLKLLDDCYTLFQVHDQTITGNLSELLQAEGFKAPEVSITTALALIKDNNQLMADYGTLIDNLLSSISNAASGNYNGPTVDYILNHLQSLKNREEIGKNADQIIQEIEKEIDGKQYGVNDILVALKNKKITQLITITRNLELQTGLDFLKGVNDVAKTNVVANAIAVIGKIEPQVLNNGMVVVLKGVSNLWQPALTNTLKDLLTSLKNPTIDGMSSISTNYFKSVGTQLTAIIQNVESQVNQLVESVKNVSTDTNSALNNSVSNFETTTTNNLKFNTTELNDTEIISSTESNLNNSEFTSTEKSESILTSSLSYTVSESSHKSTFNHFETTTKATTTCSNGFNENGDECGCSEQP